MGLDLTGSLTETQALHRAAPPGGGNPSELEGMLGVSWYKRKAHRRLQAPVEEFTLVSLGLRGQRTRPTKRSRSSGGSQVRGQTGAVAAGL